MIEDDSRSSPLEISPQEFRALGHQLVDDIAGFLASLPLRPVNPAGSPEDVRARLGGGALPAEGASPRELLSRSTKLLFDHSLLNGHPAFFGYITSSAAPIGALGDLLAASVNPNAGSFQLAPVATEIEMQTIRWIAEMTGYPSGCGGLLVSGGNMANFVGFLAARSAKTPWNVRDKGLGGGQAPLRVYTSTETHTWVKKAADMFGFGIDAIRWIPTDSELRMDVGALRRQIGADRASGDLPLMVVGTAGSVSTGAVDPLQAIARVCSDEGLWFHVDGAYGGFAAILPEAPVDLKHLDKADSLAVDPHKWLYTPLEAGCILVKRKETLREAFAFAPPYYRFEGSGSGEPPVNLFEYGPQNSRGFRALKVWLALQQVGLRGYREMIADDCALARMLFAEVGHYPELRPMTCGLSIATFRYVPPGFSTAGGSGEQYLNALNEAILGQIQDSGAAFVSNAVIGGAFALRACIVNFRTTPRQIRALPELVVRIGRETDARMRKP